MADLKFGNVTPAVGNIKLGSSNVSEIYQGATKLWPLGTPPQPGEVTVCDLIWTKTNSTITATTSGSAIPVVTNQNDWITKCQNNDPAACYWQFDSNNAFRGLYYNVFATEVIQPPTGFRVPTAQDWQELIGCAATGSPDSTQDVTSLGNNYYGFWSSNIASNSRFGTVDFNSISAGYTYQNSTTIPPAVPQAWNSQGIRDMYHQQQPGSLPASYYPITMFWRGPQGANQDWIVGYSNAGFADGFQGGKNGGALMRFVKDAPPPSSVEFYDNDQQTGTPTSSRNLAKTFFGGSFAQNTNFGSVVVTGAPGTIYLYQYQQAGSSQGYFGNQTSSNQTGGAVRLWSDPSRPAASPDYEIEWTSGNQGGVWSNNPTFADRKEESIVIPVGTWYLKLQYYGVATSGGTTWNTGVYT